MYIKDYYQILGIDRSANNNEINKAFRILAKKYHPDINKSSDASNKFIELYEAYEILKDQEKRKEYDRLIYRNYAKKNSSDRNENTDATRTTNENETYKNYQTWADKANQRGKYYSEINYKEVLKQSFRDVGDVLLEIIITCILRVLTGVLLFASIGIPLTLLFYSSDNLRNVNLVIALIWAGFFIFSLYWFNRSNENKSSNTRLGIIFWTLVVALSLYSYFTFQYHNEEEKIKEHKQKEIVEIEIRDIRNNISKYLKDYEQNQVKDTIEIVPKLVLVDMNSNDFFCEYYSLPVELKAIKDNEINTILQVYTHEKVVGHYSDGASGIKVSFEYKIIDYKKGVVTFVGVIEGSDPPLTKKNRGEDAYGSFPYAELVDIIMKHTCSGKNDSAN